jgi:hypothetical protein
MADCYMVNVRKARGNSEKMMGDFCVIEDRKEGNGLLKMPAAFCTAW